MSFRERRVTVFDTEYNLVAQFTVKTSDVETLITPKGGWFRFTDAEFISHAFQERYVGRVQVVPL